MSQATLREAFRLLDSGQILAAGSLFQQLQQVSSAQAELAADACNGLGLCAEAQGQFVQAESWYHKALEQKPDEPEYLNNLAICLIRKGQSDDGLAIFERLTVLNPPAEAYFNLALALTAVGQAMAAVQVIADLLKRFPHLQQPLDWLRDLLITLDQHGSILEALQLLDQQAPDEPVFQLALATVYQARGNSQLALRYFRAALRCNPDLLGAYPPLIQLLRAEDLYPEARAMVKQRYGAEQTLVSVVEQVISLWQPVPASEAEIQQSCAELSQLLAAFDFQSQVPEVYLPQILPFYLAYQLGDVRSLQEQLAAFFAGFLSWELPVVAAKARPRLGIFSVHFFQHSVTDFSLRAIQTLLHSDVFETYLFAYALAGKADQITAQLQQEATHFIEIPDALPQAIERIASCQLDLLIYTDLGMDPYSYVLALNRLARRQMVLPGHPVTTGLINLDYFISAEALEVPEADTHYSETLVRLPGLPDYPRPLQPLPADRPALGLMAGNLYFCPVNIFKIQPAFDAVLARILSLDPEAQILLLEYKNQLHLQLQKRFAARFPAQAERLHFALGQAGSVFQRLLAVDVMLDTFPFGGGNTSYQALGLGCPIVCLDVPWQKGRWTQAMYQLMGVEGLVAPDPEAYARLAVQVARDKSWQAALRQEISTKSAILFDNPTWSKALLDFCQQQVQS